jgi:hypothetical protein
MAGLSARPFTHFPINYSAHQPEILAVPYYVPQKVWSDMQDIQYLQNLELGSKISTERMQTYGK